MVKNMIFKSKKGFFELTKVFKDCFDLEKFEECYVEECYDNYEYIVGDISSDILRLKGFDKNPNSKKYFGLIDEYIEKSCPFQCPYYVVKRIPDEATYEKMLAEKHETIIVPILNVESVTKVNFDKETLVLESNPAVKPNIVIDSVKMNAMPSSKKISTNELEDTVEDTVYTSTSENYVPDANRQNNRFQYNNNNGNQKNNNNRNNNNNNKNKNKNNNGNSNQNNKPKKENSNVDKPEVKTQQPKPQNNQQSNPENKNKQWNNNRKRHSNNHNNNQKNNGNNNQGSTNQTNKAN